VVLHLRDMANRTHAAGVTEAQRGQLEAVVAKRIAHAGLVRRARVILLSAEGLSGAEIARRVGCSPEQVSRLRGRWAREGINGLFERPKTGRKDHALPVELVHRIVALATSPPPAGRSRWTARLLGRVAGCSFSSVAKVLREHDLKPHRSRTFKVSRDPRFAEKVEDVVGLYLNPPARAVVVSVDEKTSIQALQRTQLPLPLRTGRAVRHTHDYKRHGVIDLYAALEVATGCVTHACTENHTAVDFLAFMKKNRSDLPAQRPARDPRQFVHARNTRRRKVAGTASSHPLPLHADQRVLAQSGRGSLRNFDQTVAQPGRLHRQGRPTSPHRRLLRGVEQESHPLCMDQTGEGHHPKSCQDA
jgi:transposase